MAEVLAPIVQQSGPITMLHTPTDAFQTGSPTQSHHQSPRSSQMPRSHLYNVQNTVGGYRGTAAAPVAPYAFQATPQLRTENRSTSAPGNPHQGHNGNTTVKLGHPTHPSSSSESTISSSSSNRSGSKDDMSISTNHRLLGSRAAEDIRRSVIDARPASTITLSTSVPDLSLATFDVPAKSSPDRYRRVGQRRVDSNSSTAQPSPEMVPPMRSAMPSGSGMAAVAHLYNNTAMGLDQRPQHLRANSADDTQLPRQGSEQAKRYRRRSLGALDVGAFVNQGAVFSPSSGNANAAFTAGRPEVKAMSLSNPPHFHERNNSRESVSSSSTSTRPSSARQESKSLRPAPSTTSPSSTAPQPRTVNVPPRGSSDTSKRLAAPSPLSKPVADDDIQSPQKKSNTDSAPAQASLSPAVQHLAALSDKDANKGMKSRLRRAFSFGSAAELRKASAENNLSAERAKLRKERYQDEQDAEDAAIAAKQEAAGIGAGIYSGQGNIFSGSTDNLSISSTASSASVMLRKMGRGMKKGGRSLKGLFRPKSVIGVPAADGPVVQPSLAQVSMVTVEAEREKVNVNADPHDQVGGGTGFPKLERNSIDAARAAIDVPGSSGVGMSSSDSVSRKSIVGGEKERAEILAAVRKGILKRTGTGSGSSSPVARPAELTDSPRSVSPATPQDDPARGIPLILGEDYFGGGPRFPNASTKSLPNTPHGTSRSISFSPRIQFHDAWSSSEYDRRGDIATCNRLTPMLAQQIKEELNTFKMEMEVHELSKPHTHFF